MNHFKRCTSKPSSFLAIHATLISNNSSRFRRNLLERIEKLIMIVDDEKWQVKSKKQYDITKEAAVLSSGKIDK